MKFISGVVVFSLAATCGKAADPTHGCNVGDVTASKATVWSRADANSTMTAVIYECGSDYTESNSVGETEVDSTNDYTGLVDITGLSHRTCYEARVTFTEEDGSVGSATYSTFYTAPRPENTRAVRFAWVGDVSGQNVCRDAEEGFPLTDAMLSQRQLDFFLNVGDAIYGDAYCYEEGLGGNTQVEGDFIRSADLENYWAHWKYNLADEDYQTFLSQQAFFMTWDDHEVINDFGPGYDTRGGYPYTAGESLMPIGMQAFLNYNPIRATSDPTEQLDFYRKVRWGKFVELFILDCRQYRSLPTDNDTLANPKTMLGEEQLTWLYESLLDSTALWKIIVTSVPLSIPTGTSDAARDGWANFEGDTGYEIELEEILRFLSDNNLYNTVFITADVHFAQVLKYQPFLNDPDFVFHEIVVGPMNAAPFNFDDLDDSFNPERLFMYAPDLNSLSGAYTYDELKEYFNFGLAEIETDGSLTFSVIANDNEVKYNITLSPHED